MPSPSDLLLSPRLRRALWIFLAAVLVARLGMLAVIPITDNSESRYAEMARHMTTSGDWLTPWFAEGVPFWAKPPLAMWLSALGIRLFGETEFGARFFIFALAAAMVALGYRWLRRHRGPGFALAGTAVLATSFAFTVVSGAVMTDLALCFGTTLAMFAFFDAVSGPPRRLPGYLFFAGLAVGLLAKGPIALVLTGLPVGAWTLWRRRWKDGWQRLPWISGGLAMIAVAAPWYMMAEHRTPGFLRYFLLGEHFGRFMIPGWTGDRYGKAHAETVGMIWVFGFLSLCPWALSLPWLAAKTRTLRQQLQEEARSDGWSAYLVCWLLAPLIFFTPARNIISTYALTGVPAGAWLLVEGWRLATAGSSAGARTTARWLAGGMALAALMLGGIQYAFSQPADRLPKPSRREIVRRALNSPEFANAHLSFLGSRSFSAQFYSHGQADLIEEDQLESLLRNDRIDLLVVREPVDKRFHGPMRDRFSPIARIGDEVLFLETPHPRLADVAQLDD